MRKGSQKGSAFERTVCKSLSKWWTNNEHSQVFWRSASSGGRATRVKGIDQFGDVVAIEASGFPLTDILVIEAKKGYGNWSPFDIVDGASRIFDSFCAQVLRDKKASKRPFCFLIFQRNRRQICLCTQPKFFSVYFPDVHFDRMVKLKDGRRHWTIVSFEEFMKKCKSSKILEQD